MNKTAEAYSYENEAAAKGRVSLCRK